MDFESILCSEIRKQGCNEAELLAYVNKRTCDEDGYTALHLAAHRGNFLGIKYLISQSANTQLRSN